MGSIAGRLQRPVVLGLKGTRSEAELHLIRSRVDGGLRNKAKRGEVCQNLPVGLDRHEDGLIVLAADEQVRHAIGRVFELRRPLGSARQVVKALVARIRGCRAGRRAAAGQVEARELWRGPRPADQPERPTHRQLDAMAARPAADPLERFARLH
jgi:DNA invertase Pin-like site-specific DNA recombinase